MKKELKGELEKRLCKAWLTMDVVKKTLDEAREECPMKLVTVTTFPRKGLTPEECMIGKEWRVVDAKKLVEWFLKYFIVETKE